MKCIHNYDNCPHLVKDFEDIREELKEEIERLTTRINNAIIYMKTHRYAASTVIREILQGIRGEKQE